MTADEPPTTIENSFLSIKDNTDISAVIEVCNLNNKNKNKRTSQINSGNNKRVMKENREKDKKSINKKQKKSFQNHSHKSKHEKCKAEKEYPLSSVSLVKNNYIPQRPEKICRHWLNGHCFLGDSCGYAHPLSLQGTQEKICLASASTTFCKFEMLGSCLKGPGKCPFSHDYKILPCRFYFGKGFCQNGSACRYSHEPVSETKKEEIIKEWNSYKKVATSSEVEVELSVGTTTAVVTGTEEGEIGAQVPETNHGHQKEAEDILARAKTLMANAFDTIL